uniref:Beta-barrel assembly machine subunit BamC n=1 Tax=Candidatus Kentrum sp. MB TaxID=2138164 RepID=A0A451B8F2_9GAMM|nr:MAG: Beta-barrel assembly machine subunit BamC [Candidatus Kentron sp. MB]VFK26558.1 MAG: Beta-barrel assembly machine subunit BamC [Candidatus Kentron sp. MB]VFK74551.1 MAG: Beta-barrel assembly machine subunit BamC [Candidatus Kentron sp. MB]
MKRINGKRMVGCIVVATGFSLAGCGVLEETIDEKLTNKKVDYKASRSMPPLEVPPDLVSPSGNNAIEIPHTGSTTYSEYAKSQGALRNPDGAVLPQFADIRVMQDRDVRWLVIQAAPDRVWPRVRNFWLKNGFTLKMDDPSIGILETDWAENRADIPSGFIRGMLGKLFDSLYSAATRDKFRVRLERGDKPEVTELYLSHRGAEEVSQGESFVWQSRPSDPELEAEMLSRVMTFLGISEEKAEGMLAAKRKPVDRASLLPGGPGKPTVLSVQEQFSRAWRRTRIALDRTGFTIEDRDRSRGLFYIRYIDPNVTPKEKKGWFSNLKFWGGEEKKAVENQYLISLREQGAKDDASTAITHIAILDKAGNPIQSETTDRILGLLYEQLK